eukprot:CAMPEP_0194155750 /NCGR_PEP_ID=MMETSP0152-20130528/65746_1 /TAXON_ID=1049557 /ORGANISM="Thalassiothrix antarctica, Strain L6-D1" /LENGTH=560 /DNA_ID=CAMNT_0038862875 /DNA_START=113 /DNA_END=1795 /DNA_ORIENTATION=-
MLESLTRVKPKKKTKSAEKEGQSFSMLDPENKTAMKILFLSSDTGGGHRASCESLAKQFQLLYPGSSYILLDTIDGYFPMPKTYKHLSAHPTQWKLFYEVTNSRAFEMIADANMKLMSERGTRKKLMALDPDVVVSVHPMMTNVPQLSCAKISQQTGKHIPIFTVVTDLGSGHCLWFANGMEKMFVGSDQICELAKKRGNVPEEKLVKIGLPIRHDFAIQAEKLGDRISIEGKLYQETIRKSLDLPYFDRPTLLVMGGGEGIGSLSVIVDTLYMELVMNGIDAIILVVCGRNEKLKKSLDERDWEEVLHIQSELKAVKDGKFTSMCTTPNFSPTAAACIDGSMTHSLRKILSSGSIRSSALIGLGTGAEAEKSKSQGDLQDDRSEGKIEEFQEVEEEAEERISNDESSRSSESLMGNDPLGDVVVIGLGFVNNISEYMVAADILVTKAGPGTISEAASVSLPVLLTSFLPGQEEGNVDYVLKNDFGTYVSDSDPSGIAEVAVTWLRNEDKYQVLSRNAKAKGAPNAARDIAEAIGESTLRWKEINEENGKVSISDISNKD